MLIGATVAHGADLYADGIEKEHELERKIDPNYVPPARTAEELNTAREQQMAAMDRIRETLARARGEQPG